MTRCESYPPCFETIYFPTAPLTHRIQKPLNHLIFSGFTGMDLRGIEPLSESSSIKASPITVILLTFPP